ncbi:MAG: DUF177 domain-containing protein [Herminiimonas sp.]|nr:DUF177 domain-containing protein [Herminiimonas sp.]
MKPAAIDAFDFGRGKDRRDGEVAVAELPRLAHECVDASGILRWEIVGGTHASGHPQLVMHVAGDVQLVCQRCLQPFGYPIHSASTLVLAHDEAQADQIEAMLDDETLDVIVGSATMNLVDLIEDEALLAIPQAPKHASCPGAETRVRIDDSDAKPSPFAVLKNLKH